MELSDEERATLADWAENCSTNVPDDDMGPSMKAFASGLRQALDGKPLSDEETTALLQILHGAMQQVTDLEQREQALFEIAGRHLQEYANSGVVLSSLIECSQSNIPIDLHFRDGHWDWGVWTPEGKMIAGQAHDIATAISDLEQLAGHVWPDTPWGQTTARMRQKATYKDLDLKTVIGKSVHSAICVDDQGKVECICGLEK